MDFVWFWGRKMLSRVFFPVPLVMEFLLLSLVLLCMKGTQRLGRYMLMAALALLYVVSAPICSNWAMAMLERQYPPLLAVRLDALVGEAVVAAVSADGVPAPIVVAVAGSGFYLREEVAALGAERRPTDLVHGLNEPFLLRLQEAGRIAQYIRGRGGRCRVLVASFSPVTPTLRQEAFSAYFSAFGLPADEVVLIDGGYNSKQEVARFAEESRRFILVSQASHVPRLMGFSRRMGCEAIPAPAGYRCRPAHAVSSMDFIPSADGLFNTQILIYELLGSLGR